MKIKNWWKLAAVCLLAMGAAKKCARYPDVVTRIKVIDGNSGGMIFPDRKFAVIDSCNPYAIMARLYPCAEGESSVTVPYRVLSEDGRFCLIRQAYLPKSVDFGLEDIREDLKVADLILIRDASACDGDEPSLEDFKTYSEQKD